MKELFNKLSVENKFFTEKRLIYEKGDPEKPSGDIVAREIEYAGKRIKRLEEQLESVRSTKTQAAEEVTHHGAEEVVNAMKYCTEYQNALDEHHCRVRGGREKPATAEISDLWGSDREFPGRKKLFHTLRYKIAKAGITEVTDAEIEAYTKKWFAENPGEEEIEDGKEGVRRVLNYNKLEDAAKAVGDYLNKNPNLRDRSLIELYIYLVKYPKYPDQNKAQEVMNRIKENMLKSKQTMAYLPNLISKPTVIARKSRRR